MIEYTIAVAQLWHCGALARKVRDAPLAIALDRRLNVHREIRRRFDASGFARSWITVDNRPLAMMGITGPLIAPEGEVWVVLSKEACRYPLAIARETRRSLGAALMIKRRILAAPYEADAASIRFAEWVGFRRIADASGDYAKAGAIPMAIERSD